ncbi:probable WRKY transcription factor 70 isoform X2 [Arachis ipaensis]|uniref:probable WRKY transcription factor 70 isoform X2 n=1 Tax=Arachis ipaensis TaxID=130454 RepID=UPI000A2B8592|nr:probable WRKY transcription factor 70 isoform X2 [Arachis ipaensis]XP_025632060.1 WRKY DNA-binding transcription factor 70-like isoform X2 [Arachis hypogaea]
MKMIMEDDDIVSREDGIKAIIEEELVRGREFADQLRQLIVINKEDDDSADHQWLLSNVLTSFANTLSLLNKYPIHPNPIHLHQSSASSSSSHNSDLLIMQMQHPQIHPCLLTDDNHICKTPPPPDTRGSYRRKNIETWKKETENEREEDGHQWRKYGQKAIQNEKYTRNYFRCTHKYEQGCRATKQVQRIQEKPPLYRATYHGRHTCTNTDTTNNHVLIMEELDYPTSSSSSIFLSFDNSFPNPPTNPFLSSSSSSLFPSTAPPLPAMMIVEEDRQVLPSTTSTHPVLDDSSRHHVVPILSSSENNNICWDDMMMMAAMSQVLYDSVDEG